MAVFVPRFLRQLRDVDADAPADGEALTFDTADGKWKPAAGGGGLTFPQILAALAAEGWTFDAATGQVSFAPTDSTLPFLTEIVAPAGFQDDSPFPGGYFARWVAEDGTVVWSFDTYSDALATSPAGNAPVAWHFLSVDYPDTYVQLRGYRPGAPGVPQTVFSIFDGAAVVVDIDSEGRVQLPGNVRILTGAGSPESVVEANIGSLYLRNDGGAGTAVYRKESGVGDTGWVAVSQTPAAHAHAGEDVTSGTVADARIAATLVRGSRQIIAGAALTGGGDLSADRTLDVAVDGSTLEVNADALRVKALGITDAHVAAANKDGTAGTASLRTLGTGAAQAAAGNHAHALDDLSDVAIATGALYEVVTNYGAGWVNGIRRSALCPGLFETIPRWTVTNNNAAIVSQRLSMYAIELPRGLTVTSITFVSATTALSVGVNQLFGLFDDVAGASSGTAWALLRGSVDDTSTAWAASTPKTLALTSTYLTTRTGLFYVGILVNATTPPSLACGLGALAGVTGIAPKMGGHSTTSITALPNPAGAPSNQGIIPYAYASS